MNQKKASVHPFAEVRFPRALSALPAAIALGLLGLTTGGQSVQAQTYTSQTVLGTSNIFGAGRTGAAATPSPGGTTDGSDPNPGGSAAPVFTIAAGTNRVLTFASVSGTMTINKYDYPYADADGDTTFGVKSEVTSAYQGISGISFTDRVGALVGVFISGPPSGYADGTAGSDAPSLTYTAATDALPTFTPLLNQTFFVGDGLTGDGTGAAQQFFVPNGATALVLGFSDSPGANGAPGSFNDNAGSINVAFSVNPSAAASAPEPGSIALLALGLTSGLPSLGLIRGRMRRRNSSVASV